jgi:hypothetical protein
MAMCFRRKRKLLIWMTWGERGILSSTGITLLHAVKQLSNSGNPAVIGLSPLRPVTLRPYLSIGLPFYRMSLLPG